MIKWVRKYKPYGLDTYDVMYESGKVRCFIGRCPKTVSEFIASANKQTEQMDWLNGLEILYEKEA